MSIARFVGADLEITTGIPLFAIFMRISEVILPLVNIILSSNFMSSKNALPNILSRALCLAISSSNIIISLFLHKAQLCTPPVLINKSDFLLNSSTKDITSSFPNTSIALIFLVLGESITS